MKDKYGREIDYLRISVTDRCNLRCIYCMPADGGQVVPEKELLTPAEIERVARAAVDVGFRKFRLTGGEPTLRDDIVEIVERLTRVRGIQAVVMTTNGLRFPWLAQPLARAGLQRVNIHLDSLNEEHLARVMRSNSLPKAWAGIEAAERAGLIPIKLNAVVTRGYNDEDVVDLARLSVERDWHVRFIELMPLGVPADIALRHYVPTHETMARIEAALGPLLPINGGAVVGEARTYRLPERRGSLGFISPVSDSYCHTCNRLRVTASGRVQLCLLSEREMDFGSVLREGGTHEELVALFARAVGGKPAGNQLREGAFPAHRSMSQIGG